MYSEKDFDEIIVCEEIFFLLVLDGIMDLYNLGVCLWSVDVVGVYVIIVFKDKLVKLNGIVCKVVCGVVEIVLFV